MPSSRKSRPRNPLGAAACAGAAIAKPSPVSVPELRLGAAGARLLVLAAAVAAALLGVSATTAGSPKAADAARSGNTVGNNRSPAHAVFECK